MTSEIERPQRGFKRKTIIANIKMKMKAWIKTLPPELGAKVWNDYILTGGAITSMLMGENPNDYDVYFQTPDVALEVANHYIAKLALTDKISRIEAKSLPIHGGHQIAIGIKSAGVMEDGINLNEYQYFECMPPGMMDEYFKKDTKETKDEKVEPYRAALISTNAISLHNNVQIITRFVGPSEWIHTNYDFVHCTNYYTEKGGLVLRQDALESILSKELKYVGSLYPICSMFRIKKFIKRGWSITAGEMLKISWDISKLNLTNMEVLKDQLVGVDVAYFMQLLRLLGENKDIDRTYLFECVNRVFDSEELAVGKNHTFGDDDG